MLPILLISVLLIFVLYQAIDMVKLMRNDVKQMGNYMAFRAMRIAPFRHVDRQVSLELTKYQLIWFDNHFPYYDTLSQKEKLRFHNRVAQVLAYKKFVPGKADFPLTPNKELYIVSVLAYMTLWLDRFDLPAFQKVIVYPKAYFNKNTGRYHKGETNMKGAVVFSWKDFKEGFADSEDNLNLALHEFAHALSLQSKFYPRFSDVRFSFYLDQWKDRTKDPALMRQMKESGYFRSYAYTNEEELFAVATECFFETPASFSQELPYLYGIIAKIYNVDMAKKLAPKAILS